MVVVKETFPESTSRTQTHTIEIDKLKEVESVTVDGGEVEIVSVEDGLVTLQFRARNWDRRVQTGGSYTAADSKYVSNQSSSYYNSGGYSGTLSSYVYSGSLTPRDSKSMSRMRETTYRHYRKYSGSKWVDDGIVGSPLPSSISYDLDGYRGTLHYDYDLTFKDEHQPPSNPSTGDRYVWLTERLQFIYSGTVTRPEVDTRVYRYRGTVRRPARDTRTWAYYYQYSVTINYIEKGFEIQTKIDGQLRTANEGWVKIDGQLRPIEYIYTKIDGQIVEVD